MRVLGIDTATRIASIGVADERGPRGERRAPMSGSHARTVLPLLADVLAAAGLSVTDLDLLAVSIGPGSFTGLRIGLSVAKGLAVAAGLPVIGVPTLEAYVRTLGPRPGAVWPVLDARKGEVYAAGFRWNGQVLECFAPPATHAPGALASRMHPPCTLLGDGVDAYREHWEARLAQAEYIGLDARPPSGAMVACIGAERRARLGADDVSELEPTYCRLSEAETHRQRSAAHGGGV